MSFDKTPKSKPISLKNIAGLNLQANTEKFIASILYQKTDIVKQAIIKELDLRQSQFETILRKEASKFTTVTMPSGVNSLMKEQYFFEGKYLFSIEIKYKNLPLDGEDNQTVVSYEIEKEAEDFIYKFEYKPLEENETLESNIEEVKKD